MLRILTDCRKKTLFIILHTLQVQQKKNASVFSNHQFKVSGSDYSANEPILKSQLSLYALRVIPVEIGNTPNKRREFGLTDSSNKHQLNQNSIFRLTPNKFSDPERP